MFQFYIANRWVRLGNVAGLSAAPGRRQLAIGAQVASPPHISDLISIACLAEMGSFGNDGLGSRWCIFVCVSWAYGLPAAAA
jgi:hypothetical protein